MTDKISARSENYDVTVDSNNNAHVEKYNHPSLVAYISDRIKKKLMPYLTEFKALPRQPPIDVNALEIKIDENDNRIIIRDKNTGISNRAIGFLR